MRMDERNLSHSPWLVSPRNVVYAAARSGSATAARRGDVQSQSSLVRLPRRRPSRRSRPGSARINNSRGISYFADWLCGAGATGRAGERPATFSAEGSKRRKRSGAATSSVSLHRGQSPAAAATVALNLLSHRSQKNTGPILCSVASLSRSWDQPSPLCPDRPNFLSERETDASTRARAGSTHPADQLPF
jgi:hypothetical protein